VKKLKMSKLKKVNISRFMFAILLLGALIAPVHMFGVHKSNGVASQKTGQPADKAVDKESKVGGAGQTTVAQQKVAKKSFLGIAREKLIAFKETLSRRQIVAIVTATVVGLYGLVTFFSENNEAEVSPEPVLPVPAPAPGPDQVPVAPAAPALMPPLIPAEEARREALAQQAAERARIARPYIDKYLRDQEAEREEERKESEAEAKERQDFREKRTRIFWLCVEELRRQNVRICPNCNTLLRCFHD
jgi:hypothetical protein